MTQDLRQPKADRQTASTGHARWLAPTLAAAVVTAVAIGVTAIATTSNGSAAKPNSPAGQASTSAPGASVPGTSAPDAPASSMSYPSTSAPSTSAPGTTAPASRPAAPASPIGASHPVRLLLPSGAQRSRAQVPWSQVGPGWHLATIAGSRDVGSAALYLLNPIGGLHLIIDQLPADNWLRAWSPDGKRALFGRYDSSGRTFFTELELATGKLLPTFGVDGASFVSYTRPQGKAVLLTALAGVTSAGTSFALQKFSTDGRHELTYPTTLPGLGAVTNFTALYSFDGGEVLVGAKNGIALLSNDGQLIRALPAPAGREFCAGQVVDRGDGSGELPEQHPDESPVRPPSELFIQPVAGGSPTKLIGGSSAAAPFGFDDAWKYSDGVLLLAASGCGPGDLDLLRNGVVTKLVLPAGITSPPSLQTVDGDVVTVRSTGDCMSASGSMVSINIVTGARTTLFKGTGSLLSYPAQERR